MDRALTLMVVFFGGGIGCVLRLLIDGNTTSPFTITNVCACLLMGMSYSLICYRVWLTNKFVISFVNVGFLGGLSTITPLAIYVLHTDLVSNCGISHRLHCYLSRAAIWLAQKASHVSP